MTSSPAVFFAVLLCLYMELSTGMPPRQRANSSTDESDDEDMLLLPMENIDFLTSTMLQEREDNETDDQFDLAEIMDLCQNDKLEVELQSPLDNCQQVRTDNELQSLTSSDKNQLAPKLGADHQGSNGTQITWNYKDNFDVNERIQREASERIPCSYCNKTFKQKRNLYKHWRVEHKGCERLACSHCNRTFKYRSSLLDHQRAVHKGSERIPCSYCNRTFEFKKSLLEHQRTAHEASNGSQCPHCNKIFKYKRGLTHHIRKLHPSSDGSPLVNGRDVEKNFPCQYPECSYSGPTINARRMHNSRVHKLNITQSKRSRDTAGQENGPPSKRRMNEAKLNKN